MRAPISFVYGNCVFGATLSDCWAAFVAETHTYDGLQVAAKQARFGALMGAVETVEADLQILRVSRRWDVEHYGASLRPLLGGPHATVAHRYLGAHLRHLQALAPERPAVFVLARLREPDQDVATYVSRAFDRSPRSRAGGRVLGAGDRPGPADATAERQGAEAARAARAAGPPGGFVHWLAGALGRLDRRLLSVAELERLRARADRVHARLASFIAVRPARVEELQWLVRRGFCRGLGEPEIDGLHEPRALVCECNGEAVLAPLEGDVVRWMDGFVEHRGKALRIESELGTSWQASLVVGALPERVGFPSPRLELMFAPPESLPFGVDLALCARYLPNDLAARIARRKIQDADQILQAESDGEQGPSDRGYERTQHARDLLAYLQSSSRPPLLRASLAIAVAAPSERQLEERVELCRRAYGEIRLHRPLGDQLELFCQHLPGQPTRVAGYDDTLTCEQVAAMMPTATHAVGSRAGFYLGRTLAGRGSPVRFSLREGSELDRGAAILSVGALGAGKTTLDQKLKYEAFLLGARIVDCDPKGDHRFHLLEEVAPHTECLALRPDPALRGMLDPLRVAPAHLRQDAAVSFLRELLPARAEPAWEAAVVRAVDAVLASARRPTCLEVVRALAAGDATERQVARMLEVYARGGLTQLGFADPAVALPAVGERQVTYLPIRDLPAPAPGTARSEYSQAERVGEQLVRLLAMFAMHLMSAERERLKVFSFDEGWRLLGDPVGRALLASLQRMGRSELAVPIISTQLVTDTLVDERESLHNLLGAIFVFGMRAEGETSRALGLLGLDPQDTLMRRRLQEFDRGRCLFRDHRGRVEAIQVELVLPELLRAFSTTPPPA